MKIFLDVYLKLMKLDDRPDNLSKKLDNLNHRIVDELIENFFGSEIKLSFDQLNSKFERDPWFLSSGYIREICLNALKKLDKL
jgi:hypothetical protein